MLCYWVVKYSPVSILQPFYHALEANNEEELNRIITEAAAFADGRRGAYQALTLRASQPLV